MPGYSDIAKQYLEQNPYDPQIAPVAPTRNSAESRGQVMGTVNERLGATENVGQSFIREGEAKAQGAQQSAGVLQQSKADAGEIHQRAMARLEGNQALQDQYRKLAEKDLAGVKERGMANWGPLLTGIIGAAAGAAGNQGLAQGLGMLGNVIERSAQAKAQNANTTFQGHQELARTAMADSTNAVDAGTKLMAQEHELAARDLERIAQETSIPTYRETALRLAEDAREKGLQIRQGYYAAEAGRQESVEARRAKANRPKLTIQDEEALFASGQASPEVAKNVLARRTSAVGIDATNEQIRASQNKENAPKAPTEAEVKRDMIVEGGRPAYERLAKLGDKGTNWGATAAKWVPDALTDTTSLQQRADINALTGAVLRNESGASISEGDIAAMVDAHPVNSGDEKIRKAALADLMNHFKGMDTKGRTAQADADKAQAAKEKAGARDIAQIKSRYKVK